MANPITVGSINVHRLAQQKIGKKKGEGKGRKQRKMSKRKKEKQKSKSNEGKYE